MSRKQKHNNKPKTSAPVLDVVITTSGRFDMLAKCLDALKRESETVPMKIIVIDNASPAEERIDHEDLFRNGVFSRRLKTEVGFPQANNEGALMGTAPLILFLNDDVELHEGSVQKIVDTFRDETVGIVGIKLIFPPDSAPNRAAGKVQHVGMGMNMRGDVDHPLIGWSPDHPKTNVNRDVICVTGACMAVRRHLFNKVQGFGLEYGWGTWEDVDLCFKVRGLGLRVYVNTDATGYHYAGATQEKKRRGFPVQQNRLIFQSKWQSTGLMAWTSWEFY